MLIRGGVELSLCEWWSFTLALAPNRCVLARELLPSSELVHDLELHDDLLDPLVEEVVHELEAEQVLASRVPLQQHLSVDAHDRVAVCLDELGGLLEVRYETVEPDSQSLERELDAVDRVVLDFEDSVLVLRKAGEAN